MHLSSLWHHMHSSFVQFIQELNCEQVGGHTIGSWGKSSDTIIRYQVWERKKNRTENCYVSASRRQPNYAIITENKIRWYPTEKHFVVITPQTKVEHFFLSNYLSQFRIIHHTLAHSRIAPNTLWRRGHTRLARMVPSTLGLVRIHSANVMRVVAVFCASQGSRPVLEG